MVVQPIADVRQARSLEATNTCLDFSESYYAANMAVEEELDPRHEVIMGIDMRDNSTIGCAYYSTETNHLVLSEDISAAGMDVAEQFLMHIRPTTILVSRRSSSELLTFLESQAASGKLKFRTYLTSLS